jgi:endonuclease/exonuclease/phosphatase family metal-dependent hydrolase
MKKNIFTTIIAMLSQISSFAYAEQLPFYIKPENFEYIAQNPEPYLENKKILGIYYNVLYPEEHQVFEQNAICAWLQDFNDDAFPFEEQRFVDAAPFFLGRTPANVFEGLFAEKVWENLENGFSLEEALEFAFIHIKESIVPIYERKATVVNSLKDRETNNSLKVRYETLFNALQNCFANSEKELSYAKQKYLDHKHDGLLDSLLQGSMIKKRQLELPESNHWSRRIISIKETIEKVKSYAPNSPYFLALQEVTPQSYQDLKLKFPDLNWISYNTTTKEETRHSGKEKVVGEFLSFTATLGLSQGLEVINITHEDLPSVSGSLRRILGVEVYHEASQKKFVIFTIHTDYLVKDNLYEKNVESIAGFVQKVAGNLPFICGGDFNAFEDVGGESYIANLKASAPFVNSIDYRSAPFYCPSPIAYSTFLGHVLDTFKAPFEEKAGNLRVLPNALDHIFLKDLNADFSLREAGVYDKRGHIIDPYERPQEFMEGLKERKTASDHFLNAVLFSP